MTYLKSIKIHFGETYIDKNILFYLCKGAISANPFKIWFVTAENLQYSLIVYNCHIFNNVYVMKIEFYTLSSNSNPTSTGSSSKPNITS